MKHIETMYELFEFGGKEEGDDFTEQLLDIVEDEKVKIIKCPNRYGYIFEVDNIEYEIEGSLYTRTRKRNKKQTKGNRQCT